MVLTSSYHQHFGAKRRAPPRFPEILSLLVISSSLPPEMARRTRSHTQHSDAPPPAAEPVPKQGGQQDVNKLHVEEVPEHRLGKESMTVAADNGIDLGEIMRRIERMEDVIGAIQTTVNQLNQFLLRATRQGIQLP